ncbi:MAG: Hpt domain-containing protein [Micropepsaceae bacterium]
MPEFSSKWLEAIHEREAMLGSQSLRRMAKIYIDELDAILEQAIDALRNGDIETARRAAHHLGGNAGSMDFLELSGMAQQIEEACMRADRDCAMAQIQQAIPVAQRSRNQLRQHFKLI